MKPKVQSIEDRLLEVDRVILNTSMDGCRLLSLDAPVSEIDGITGFLHELYKRREGILWELKKAGISQAVAYADLRTRKECDDKLCGSMGNG